MKNVRVALFEDMENMRALLRASLESVGFMVVQESATLDTALANIKTLNTGDVDLAIVDGNLDSTNEDAQDGAKIVSALKELGGLCVIGFSGSGNVPGADVNLQKGDFSMFSEVIKTANNLL